MGTVQKDIKEPLTGLKSLLQLILRGELTQGELDEIGPEAMNKIQQTQETIDHLLYWGNVQSVAPPTLSEVPLKGIVQEQLDRLRPARLEQKVEIEVSIEKELSVKADPERLRFVLKNLLGRSLQHTEERKISIVSSVVEDRVNLSIEHTGCTKTHVDHHRSETELVMDFMTEMKGKLVIEDKEGATLIALTLPRFSEVVLG